MMSHQFDHQPDTEIDAVFYHLITAKQHDYSSTHDTLPEPDYTVKQVLDNAYTFHPDDLDTLVSWEKHTARNIASWLTLMVIVTLIMVPHVPLFTPILTMLYMLMTAVFFIRSRTIQESQIIRDLIQTIEHPVLQWTSSGIALALSLMAYLLASIVPYSAVPASVQSLLFLVAMNFALYTPISIMRVIRQRTLRRKRV